jgi:thiol-disulfide isomerase/thioredoxin
MNEEMKDEEMKDEEMNDEEMNDDAMKDEDMKDEEMKDEEMKDDQMKDDNMEDTAMMTNEGPDAPVFALTSLKGEQVALEALKGDKVYVKFWASWCSVCLAGMEELDMLAAEATDFKVYTIVAPGHNGEQDKEDFITWFKELGYENIEVLFDETGEIQKAYGLRAVPSSAYIGSDGVLVKFAPGHMSNDVIYSFFENIN